MIRKLPVTLFSVSALFFATVVHADPANMPNGALPPMKANDKLLIPLVVSGRQNALARRFSGTVRKIHKPHALAVHRARPVIVKEPVISPQSVIDGNIESEYLSSRAVDSSA